MGAEGAQGLAGDTSMKQVKLGDAAKFIRGITFKPDDKVKPFSDGSIVCFRTSNVQSILNEQDLIAVPSKFVKRHEQFAQAGDILVSTANSWELVGKCSWVPDLKYRATIGGFISALRADPETVLPRYLYHWFNSPEIQLIARNCGRQTTNISNMDIKRCQGIIIPLPPLEQQRRIAAILDKADELRAKRRRAIAKLDELLKSVFLEMFGDPVTNPKSWAQVRLGEVTEEATYGTSIKCSSEPSDSSLPILRIPNVTQEKVNWGDLKYAELTEQEQKKLMLNSGDILFVRSNGNPHYIGRCAVFSDIKAAAFASYLIRVRLKKDSRLLPNFIQSVLSFPSYRPTLVREAQTTAGNYNINTQRLKSLQIIAPSRTEQRTYVDFANNLEAQARLQGQTLSQLDNLFSSLQVRAFSGDLTPDVLDEVEAVAAGS